MEQASLFMATATYDLFVLSPRPYPLEICSVSLSNSFIFPLGVARCNCFGECDQHL